MRPLLVRVSISQQLHVSRGLYSVAKSDVSGTSGTTTVLFQAPLADFATDRNTFIIAHRLSTVRTIGRILVLDDRQVTDDGTDKRTP